MGNKVIQADDPRYCNFTGPDPVEEADAQQLFRARRRKAIAQPSQGSVDKFVGTPRHAKHGSGWVGGVPIR